MWRVSSGRDFGRAPGMLALLATLVTGCGEQIGVAERPLAWEFSPIWSLGGSEDRRLSLTQLYSFQLGASARGDLFVLGFKERRVYVITSDGRVSDSLGRQGEGPGEFADPLSMTVGQDGSIAVVDFGLRRIARWSADKVVLDPIPLTWHLDHPMMVLDGNDAWYQTVEVVGPEKAEIQLVRSNASSKEVVARVERQPRRVVDFPTCNGKDISVQPFFAPTLQWAIAPGTIAVSAGPEYEVNVYRRGLPPVRVGRPQRPARADDAAAEREAAGYTFNGCTVPAAEAARSIGYLEWIPVVQEVALAPDGELWVRRRDTAGTASRIDVFSPAGEYIGTLPEAAPFPAAFLPSGRVAVIHRDSLDVPVLTVYQLQRRAGPS